ncbi:MAG: sugar ABC transporter permease [Chloroflexi bacterium HGW-Chloroflexi-4]|jgi:D-xylose transport system permease protein|nr:MAG: sugar ABC transporter permease [Chloroflexi bacterium HGW-Chloroflexi-4]
MNFSELGQRFRKNIQTYIIIIALVAIWGVFAIITKGGYFMPQNISNLFRQMTVTGFLAVGMVLVMVTGGIDLSVGKLAGFVSVIAALFQRDVWFKLIPNEPILSAVLTVFVSMLVGTLFGMYQAYVTAYLRVPAFIVTLGGMFILNGGILLATGGQTIAANQPGFSYIAQGYLKPTIGWILGIVVVAFLILLMFANRRTKRKYGFELKPFYQDMLRTAFFSLLVLVYVAVVNKYNGVQVPVLLLAITAIIVSYISTNTRFGRYAYAIGGNREAARLSGINIKKQLFLVFTLMGLLSGIGGVVLASYVGYGTIAAGQGYELDAIASCVLGGTSTLGGSGTIFGALVGALIMASLNTGLQMMNVAPAWQYVLRGLVLVVAVIVDVYFKKSSN